MKRLAVALHDVEPRTFERCALIRDWLDDLGVDRVTLLVMPAAGGHPFFQKSPELEAWLLERTHRGDAVAQHGFVHRQLRPGHGWPVRRWQGGAAAEFPGLDSAEARDRLLAGLRVLTEAGLAPRGFVAPAYAYTHALRRELRERFEWWGTLMRCRTRDGSLLAPAFGLGASTRTKRAFSPALLRMTAPLAGQLLRLDLHPADFEYPGHVLALESVLRGGRGRRAVTYDELFARGD